MDPVTIERTFPAGTPARLTLVNVSGEIDIQGGDGAEINVTAVKHPGRGFEQTEIEMEQTADGTVRVATKYETDLVARLLKRRHHGPCRVDYTVRVPRQTSVELTYVSGPAYVANLSGAVSLESVDGPLAVADVSGRLKLKTVSGDLRAVRLSPSGALEVETVSGDAFIGDSQLPGARIGAVSGDVHIESGLSTGDYDLRTVSGELYLRLPAGTVGTAQLSTLSGSFHSGLPGVRRNGPAVSGGVRVNANSISGDVYLAGAGDSAATPAAAGSAAPAEAKARPNRAEILDRIARGELSVDEALKDLNA